jgi:ubiquinone/menaquinone biosynthesis C-methylase UbiE
MPMMETTSDKPETELSDAGRELGSTGERIVEGGAPDRLWQDHFARYTLAVPYVVGRRVLDAACGTGYGSYNLATHGALEVTGVDIDAETVAFASQRYKHANLSYRRADVTSLPMADGSVEIVTCFETIEHVPDATKALDELTRVLAPHGTLLISTPNRTVTSPGKAKHEPPNNKFHVVEFTPSEFDQLLASRYRILARYGQRMLSSALFDRRWMRPLRAIAPFAYAPTRASSVPAPLAPGFEARYLVYVAQRQ